MAWRKVNWGPSCQQHLVCMPAALDLTPEFPGQLSGDLEGRAVSPASSWALPPQGKHAHPVSPRVGCEG
jgi:hypothetical protein